MKQAQWRNTSWRAYEIKSMKYFGHLSTFCEGNINNKQYYGKMGLELSRKYSNHIIVYRISIVLIIAKSTYAILRKSP